MKLPYMPVENLQRHYALFGGITLVIAGVYGLMRSGGNISPNCIEGLCQPSIGEFSLISVIGGIISIFIWWRWKEKKIQ